MAMSKCNVAVNFIAELILIKTSLFTSARLHNSFIHTELMNAVHMRSPVRDLGGDRVARAHR